MESNFCLFCASSCSPTFTIVDGQITRIKCDRGDDDLHHPPSTPSFLDEDNSPLLGQQLKGMFILKTILGIKEETLCSFLGKQEGQLHPEFWLQVCPSCGESVREYYKILKEVHKLQKKLKVISTELKNSILETAQKNDDDDAASVTAQVWKEVRAEVLTRGIEEARNGAIYANDDNPLVAQATPSVTLLKETLGRGHGQQKGRESFPEVVIVRQPHEIKEEIIKDETVEDGDDWMNSEIFDEAADERENDNEGDERVYSDGDDEMGGANELQSDDSDPEFIVPEYPGSSEEDTSTKKKRKREVDLVETDAEEVAEFEDGQGVESASFQCCFCWMWFESLYLLKSHGRLVHACGDTKETFQKGAFKCEEDGCSQRFQSHLDLNSHLTTHSQELHFCPACEWGFIDANLMKLHQLIHIRPVKNRDSPFHWRTCPEADCKMDCSTIPILQDHYNMKHGAKLKRFKCLECGQTAASKSSLADHERVVHFGQVTTNLPPLKPKQASKSSVKIPCDVEGCPETFRGHLQLNPHLQTHTETVNYCKTCGFGFIDVNLLKLHELVHIKPVKRGGKNIKLCPEPGCSYGIESIAQLQGHYNIKHGVSLKRFRCSECDHKSTSERALHNHIRVMHLNQKRKQYAYNQKDQKGTIKRIQKEPQTKCVDCDLEFETEGKLLGHRRLHHIRTVCPMCKVTFIGLEELRSHVATAHSQNEWKFKCETCSKPFPTAERLHFHKNNSHKDWECAECNKVFKSRPGWDAHRKAIHDPNLSICPSCGKTFSTFRNLRKHMSRRHKKTEEEHPCPHCSTVFPKKTHLRRHCQNNHPKTKEKLELACEVCGLKMKSGRKQRDMNNHMLTHMSKEERRAAGSVQICYVCGKEFLTKEGYNKHIAAHEKDNSSTKATGHQDNQESDAEEAKPDID